MKTNISIEDQAYLNQFEPDLEDILYAIKSYYPHFTKSQEDFIKKVFWFACKAHQKNKRFSGETYFTHPIAATKILLSIKPDIETISACLLHDVIEDTEISATEIEKEFGKKIRFLCEGVEKITKVRLKGKEREYESLKKLFVAMAKDIRVIFIKLADRIHNLKTLQYVQPEKQIRIAKESLKIYAPVASNLGLFDFKVTIEDLCFSYLHPNCYKTLTQQIRQSKDERKIYIEKAQKEIKKLLVKEKIPLAKIQGRTKNIYSVYEKLKRKNFSNTNEIYDLMAIRIVVKETPDCYRTLGALHSMWKPIPKRFKDYIAVPKPNGYQSLHTTILGLAKSKFPTEIQIRTQKMHLDAEYGPAAHWAYKKTKSSDFDKNYLQKTNWIPKNIIFQQQENTPAEQFFEEISKSFATDRIHVFTPKGDVKTLPDKSTPVDFAFAIHSDIGKTCVGAKVNGVIKPLNYELKTGDVVDILTKDGKKINPLWLNFVKSSHAKGHIKSYINQIKQDEKSIITPFVKKDLEEKKSHPKKKPLSFKKTSFKHVSEIIIGGESHIPYRMGKCCSPTPDKNIVAYKSRGLAFTIHSNECKLIKKLDPERFIEAHFQIRYHLQIEAVDRLGLLRDYANAISLHGINIINSKFHYQEKEKLSLWKATLTINSEREFKDLVADIQKIPNVISIKELSKF